MAKPTDTTNQVTLHKNLHNVVFDVQMFGAVGDGVTNDTAAIQAAIDAAAAAGRGVVFFPPSPDAYLTTSALNVTTSNITLKGSSVGLSHIHLSHATATALFVNGGGGGISNFTLTDLTISCFAAGPTRTAGYGVSIFNTGDFLIENVVINHGWEGLYLDQAYTGVIRRVKVADGAVSLSGQSRCFFVANSIALRFEYCLAISSHGTSVIGWDLNGGIDTLTMDHCGAQGTTQLSYGLILRNTIGASHNARWLRINTSFFEADDTAGIGVELAACYDVEFDGLYTKGGKIGVHAGSANARYVRFRGGVIQLAQEHGMLVDACDGLDVIGTLVTDNGQKTDNTYDGIIVAPTSNFSFIGVRSGDLLWNGTGGALHRQRYGINIIAGSTNYFTKGCDLRNNRTAGLNDAGTGALEGFYKTLPVVRPAAYTVTNPTTDRALNVTADTLPQVAQVLGTLIADLQSMGLIG